MLRHGKIIIHYTADIEIIAIKARNHSILRRVQFDGGKRLIISCTHFTQLESWAFGE